MKNDWIIDVLADLKSFAEVNGLTALESQLSRAFETAVSEIRSADGMTGRGSDAAGNLHRGDTGSRLA